MPCDICARPYLVGIHPMICGVRPRSPCYNAASAGGEGARKPQFLLSLPPFLLSPLFPFLPSFDRDVHQITFSFSRNSIQSDTTATGPPPSPPSRAILSRPYRRCSKKTKRMEGRKEGREGRGETFVGGSSIQYSEINFARALHWLFG